MLQKLLAGIFALSVFGSSYAQSKAIAIKGFIKDSSSGEKIAYVTLQLYKIPTSSTPYRSSYTAVDGSFGFQVADTGRYYMLISHTAYQEKNIPLPVSGNSTLITLPDIILSRTSNTLKEVTVSSKRNLVEQTDDKVVYNAENDPLAATQNATDILRRTPLVSVDGQGNVSLNGQSNFRVLLNGRETSMFTRNTTEALKAFPGKLIKKIEVITNPSAKYDAEGVGGLINIITAKKIIGYNAQIGGNYDIQGFRLFNSSFSLKSGKFGITGFYATGGQINLKIKDKEEITSLQPVFFQQRLASKTGQRTSTWQNGNIEISYDIDSLHILSAYMTPTGGKNNSDFVTNFVTHYTNNTSEPSNYSAFLSSYYPTINTGMDYIQKFKNKPAKEFSIRLNGDFGINDDQSNSIQDNLFSDRYIMNNSKARNNQYTIQSDLIQPLKGSNKLEIGMKVIFRKASSDFQSKIKYNAADNYVNDPYNTNQFAYRQDIYSAYASWSFKLKDYNFRTGIRMEHTEIDGSFISSGTIVQQRYTNLLPNLLISRRFVNNRTASFSYGMRIQRPYITSLNPFINNTDSLYISTGNPGLNPQAYHTFSLSYRFNTKKSFISTSIFYGFTNTQIISVSRLTPSTGITKTAPENTGRYQQMGTNLSITTNFNDKLSSNLNMRLAYDIVKNNNNAAEKNRGITGNASYNMSYKVNSQFSLLGYFGSYFGAVTLQGRTNTSIWYGLGAGYQFIKNKLTGSITATNFGSQFFTVRTTSKDANFKRVYDNSYLFRGMTVGLYWNFGKLTESVSKKKGVVTDDLIK